jgi:hypothetical protein
MHERHECYDAVATKPRRSRYPGAQCTQDPKEVKKKKPLSSKGYEREKRRSKRLFDKKVRPALQSHLSAVHVALHHLDLVLAVTVDNTTADIPAQLKGVALRHEGLSVWSALSIAGVVRDFHSRCRCPVASIDALVQSAAVDAECHLFDCGALLG